MLIVQSSNQRASQLGEKKIIHLTSDIGLLTSIRYQRSHARLAGEAGLMCDMLIVDARNQHDSSREKKIS